MSDQQKKWRLQVLFDHPVVSIVLEKIRKLSEMFVSQSIFTKMQDSGKFAKVRVV